MHVISTHLETEREDHKLASFQPDPQTRMSSRLHPIALMLFWPGLHTSRPVSVPVAQGFPLAFDSAGGPDVGQEAASKDNGRISILK